MGLSTIQWTDYTFNPWIGCRKVADECKFCYAETLDRNRYSKTLAPGTKENPVSHWGGGPRHRTKTWGDPLKWNKKAAFQRECPACGEVYDNPENEPIECLCSGQRTPCVSHRPRVFCASLADWLDDENVPIEWFADLLKLIHNTPNLDWLLLTKRPQNFRRRLGAAHDWLLSQDRDQELRMWIVKWCVQAFGMTPEPPANVWIGVSAGADQAAALDIPARIHFLSCEPMLRPLDTTLLSRFSWVIFGGESGSKARRCSTQWIRDGVAACLAYGVAPFVKQMGSNCTDPTGEPLRLKDSHGGDMSEWPDDLKVREFPKVCK